MPEEPAQLDLLDHPEAAPSPERALSKSKYISGLQCTKLLWHQYNAKDLIPAYDAAQQAIFDQGHEVGRRARDLYPGGVLIEREHWDMDGLLPALTGSGYEGMTIADGVTASQTFLRRIFRADHAATDSSDDGARVREDLEAYCRLDTLAMVRILDEVERLAATALR